MRLTLAAAWADPYPLYARVRDAGTLVRCRVPLVGGAWLVARHEDVSVVLRDAKRFKSSHRGVTGRPEWFEYLMPKLVRTFAKSMVTSDDGDHRRLRGLVAKVFTPARVEQLEARIEGIVAEQLDGIEPTGTFDLMAALALPLPLRIISELLGVEARERDEFHRLIGVLMADQGSLALLRQLPTYRALHRFFARLLERKRVHPGDDLTSDLVAVEQEGDRLSADELVSMVLLLLFAGHETTVNLIGNGMLALLEHPEQLQRLREQPSLVPSAVEEVLRFDSPAQFAATRYVAERCELGGRVLERGERLVPLLGAANRDGQVFDEPDALDVERDPNRHVAFGAGPHFCIGAHLSRVEGRIAFTRLLERFPRLELAVERGALRWRSNDSGLRGLAALPVRAG
ncbi:cytochrome P450 [Paraliomyxa miuraensis]|nr:cytochrome P450 [Paraliomyxa miuraensis]